MYDRVSQHLRALDNESVPPGQALPQNIKTLHQVKDVLLQEVSAEDKIYLSDVYSSEDVCINGETDNTASLIRHGLVVFDFESKSTAGQKHRDWDTKLEESRVYGIIVTEDELHLTSSARRTIPRTRSRLLQSTYGWPIKFFLDLKELLKVIGDGIKGSKV